MSKAPIIAGTMQTDPRSGGVKRSSGVNVLPIVNEGMGKFWTPDFGSGFIFRIFLS